MSGTIIGYLGPAGTFCELAAGAIYPDLALKPYPDPVSVIEAVSSGTLTGGVLPMENLLEGTVIPVLDGLTCHREVKICGELTLPIQHHLLVSPGVRAKDLTAVFSHAQALAQCQAFLSRHFPDLPCYPVSSTAEAARRISLELHSCAAIGNRQAAKIYGLAVLAENISDSKENFTRFVALSREIPPPSGKDKTSLAFSLEHRPGTLARMLNLFGRAGINLTKIESRPSRKVMGEYIFYLDFEGHSQDEKIKDVLERAEGQTTFLSIMGSYPKKS